MSKMGSSDILFQSEPATYGDVTRPKRFIRLYNSNGSALAAGDVVAIDYTETAVAKGMAVKKCATASPGTAIGAADAAIADAEWGQIQVMGPDSDVAAEDGVAGDLMMQSLSTAGRLDKLADLDGNAYASAKLLVVARCDVDETGNVAGVTWFGNLGY